MAKRTASGCDTLRDLCRVAIDCNVHRPGIDGAPGRVVGFVQCANIRDFMVMASLKCWEERGGVAPPVTIVDTTVHNTNISSDTSKGSDDNKQKQ